MLASDTRVIAPDAERWAAVPGGFPYEVSDMGRVRRSEGARHTRAGRVLQPTPHYRRGLSVRLTRMATLRGERVQVSRHWYVHRLVWTVFVGPLRPWAELEPKNGKKGDARLCNLREAGQRPRVGAS